MLLFSLIAHLDTFDIVVTTAVSLKNGFKVYGVPYNLIVLAKGPWNWLPEIHRQVVIEKELKEHVMLMIHILWKISVEQLLLSVGGFKA
jgi:hypothetical protein